MNSRFLILFILFIIIGCQNEKTTSETIDNEIVKPIEHPLQNELQGVVGENWAEQTINYQQQFQTSEQLTSIHAIYQSGINLRDTLVLRIEDYTETGSEEGLPDLFWLKEVLPGYVPQVVAEGTAYYLFNDYRQWERIARQTNDLLDDAFVELNIELYPEDSIEYFYPAYFLQTWDYGGSSLLGRGIHTSLLNTMERHWGDSTQQMFRAEVLAEKERLLNDILESTDGGYWESQENILNELSEIISTDFKVLTKNDKIALRQRQKQFQQPKKNNILINVINNE